MKPRTYGFFLTEPGEKTEPFYQYLLTDWGSIRSHTCLSVPESRSGMSQDGEWVGDRWMGPKTNSPNLRRQKIYDS